MCCNQTFQREYRAWMSEIRMRRGHVSFAAVRKSPAANLAERVYQLRGLFHDPLATQQPFRQGADSGFVIVGPRTFRYRVLP